MKIIEIKQDQREKWDEFVRKNPYSSLLQSWKWGEVQEALGHKVYRFAVVDKKTSKTRDKDWKLVAQIVKHKLPFGKCYLYCPRGPVLDWGQVTKKPKNRRTGEIKILLDKTKQIAQKEKAIFFRIDPAISLQSADYSLQQIKDLGFQKGQKEIQPKCTLILDITKSEEEILAQMKSKTRYNIRLGQRKNLEVRQSINEKDVDIFWKLAQETRARDAFSYHPKAHYQKMVEILGLGDLARLFTVYYQDKPLACNIVTFFKDTACYTHGASSSGYRNLMATYILQWEGILEAKKRGLKYYDFWGIMPSATEEQNNQKTEESFDKVYPEQSRGAQGRQKNKLFLIYLVNKLFSFRPQWTNWAGITRFKRGFAPLIAPTCYIGSQDLPYSKFWYFLFNLAHKIKK